MGRKRQDQLEPWMLWLRDALAARGQPARLAYDDKVAGDVLLLSIDSAERDRLVELTVTRRPKGRAHLAVLATTAEGVAAAHGAMARMHTEISRLANAKRKFIHRIVRLLEQLDRDFASRSLDNAAHADALTRLRTAFPEATAMTGIGFHVEVAGVDDHHTHDVYPTLFGAAVLLDNRWRGIAYDPDGGRWLMRAGTMTALKRARPTADLDAGGISLFEAGAIGAAAAAAIAAGAVDVNTDLPPRSKDSERTCDLADMFDPCDIVDCTFSLADLGNCVPDCSAIDCGAIDCSL